MSVFNFCRLGLLAFGAIALSASAAGAQSTKKAAPGAVQASPNAVQPKSGQIVTKPSLALTPQKSEASYKTARVAANAVRLQLNKAFYNVGEKVSARLQFSSIDPQEDRILVHVVSKSKDVEFVILKKISKGVFETEISNAAIATAGAASKPHDGKLETSPGEMLIGLVFIDAKKYAVGASVVADAAIVGSNAPNLPALVLAPKAMSDGEKQSQQSGAPYGTLIARGGLPLDIALGQVIFTPNGMADLKAFLDYSGGKVVSQSAAQKLSVIDKSDVSYLVSVPLDRARDDRLADLRAVFGETGDVLATQQATLKTFALVMEYRLKGFAVSANPRLSQHGAFSTTEMRSGVLSLDGARANLLTDALGSDCAPTDVNCPVSTPRLWAHIALWDFDNREVPVAFVDQGFATASPDFRRPRSGAAFVECDFERIPFRCAPGAANTPPTVGASLVGERVWHGTGSVSTAGGVLNNRWTPGGVASGFDGGAAGPAGQVLVPMMYRMGLGSYAFQMGAAIRRATDDGAACINIAAGYPCNVRLTLVGDFELCNPAARAAACATLIGATTLAATTASAAACSSSGFLGGLIDAFLPGVGSTIAATTCAAVTSAGATAVGATITACTALVALGDTRGPMQAGINHATSRGVPIIASMGNSFNAAMVPPEIAPFLDPSTLTMDGDQLQIVPAVLDPVISVGAAITSGPGTPWVNSQIRGRSVAVWAPEDNPYIAPTIGAALPTTPSQFNDHRNHGGTSAASSYVAGVVAAMQAVNPQLNPNTPGLSAAARRNIPRTIETILSETATPMGTGATEPARLPMVNAWAAVNRAWGAWPAGFETRLNFDDTGADDIASGARTLGADRIQGTIIAVAGSPVARDVDFYRVAPSTRAGSSGSTFRVTLRFPERVRGADAGRLELVGAGWTLGSDTPSTTGSPPLDSRVRTLVFNSPPIARGGTQTFQIRGVGDEDNVYTIEAAEFAIAPPDRFDRDDTGNLARSRPDNNTSARAVPIGVSDGLAWPSPSGAAGISMLVIPSLNFHDASDVDWFSFDAFPPPSGSGSCVNRFVEISWTGNVRYELGNAEGSMTEVSRESGTTTISIRNPAPGLKLKTSRAPGAVTSDYELRISHTALAVPSGSPLCRR